MEKILVVEDELIVARDIKKTLERNGYKVIGVARSTDKALQMIEEGRPTLVLVDIFLKEVLPALISLKNSINWPFPLSISLRIRTSLFWKRQNRPIRLALLLNRFVKKICWSRWK